MNWFKQIFTAKSGMMSSKRVCGVLGFLVTATILIYCTYVNRLLPDFADVFFISCCSLLGVDSVTEIWKNSNKNSLESAQN